MVRNKIKATEFQKNSLVSIITHTINHQNFFHIVRLCGSMKSTKTSKCNLVFFLAARILWNEVFLDLVFLWLKGNGSSVSFFHPRCALLQHFQYLQDNDETVVVDTSTT
jgi:hypothetical protein